MKTPKVKHAPLLGLILLLLSVQPFAHGYALGLMISDLLAAVVLVFVLLVVFEGRRKRITMFALAVPAIASNALLYVVPDRYQLWCGVLYSGFAATFLGLSVAVILRDAFRKQVIASDQMIAGVNGFLIAGVAWGHVYLLLYLLSPESFATSDRVAAYVKNVHERRFEFNHLSFATLTGLSFGDLAPVGRAARTVAWMEATFCLFYMAVIIGLLVSLKMVAPTSGLIAGQPPHTATGSSDDPRAATRVVQKHAQRVRSSPPASETRSKTTN